MSRMFASKTVVLDKSRLYISFNRKYKNTQNHIVCSSQLSHIRSLSLSRPLTDQNYHYIISLINYPSLKCYTIYLICLVSSQHTPPYSSIKSYMSFGTDFVVVPSMFFVTTYNKTKLLIRLNKHCYTSSLSV